MTTNHTGSETATLSAPTATLTMDGEEVAFTPGETVYEVASRQQREDRDDHPEHQADLLPEGPGLGLSSHRRQHYPLDLL